MLRPATIDFWLGLLRGGWRAVTTLATLPSGLFSPAQIEVSTAENQPLF
jgi:hypothetical protein